MGKSLKVVASKQKDPSQDFQINIGPNNEKHYILNFIGLCFKRKFDHTVKAA